ncbi:uncharacterized protein EDB91DRAFT_1245242 [Suillus paluster]|uniref:uncharacterized protein n=1 Tax=Suillus paluster TaxID=48578 RepID=UPI001B871694|nr:uncharacterized protein EDB91DRAFT_1245242 [Suillus paluster]KAG1747753.1 hypothetical protein EDB91DRAFT_1245242 [Suillus paluster]
MSCSNQKGGGVWVSTPASMDTGRKENEDTCIKLFSDSAKNAKEQAVFLNDEDLEVQQLFKEDPKAFIKPVSTCFGTLMKKYNEFNKELKQSGAGKTYAELQEDLQMNSLINDLENFPGGLTFTAGGRQTQLSITHSLQQMQGKISQSTALEDFNVPKQSQPPATGDDDVHMDDDPEDGEIVEIRNHTKDDMMVDQSPHMESFESQSSPPSPLLPPDHSPSDTPSSFSLAPLPCWTPTPSHLNF